MIRDAEPCAPHAGDLDIECVTVATASEWAAFLDAVYRLPASPWLLALAGRAG